jgi:peptide/nickel transport system permease protein
MRTRREPEARERSRTSPGDLPVSGFVLAALLLLSLLVNPLTGRDPLETNAPLQYSPPSLRFPFGTDSAGRDLFARVFAALRIDLGIAVGSSLAAFAAGSLTGAVAGYLRGPADAIIMRLYDVTQSIPGLLLGLLVLTAVGAGIGPLIFILAMINVPVYGRMIREEILPLAASPAVEAARLSQVPEPRILFVYLVPRCVTSVVAYLPVQAGFAMSLAAGFGFLGVGVNPPLPEWGGMIREGFGDLVFLGMWWTTLWPGLFLASTIVLLYRTGDWLLETVTGVRGMSGMRMNRCG